MTSSLTVTDQEAQSVAKAPRATVASMEAKIKSRYDILASPAVNSVGHKAPSDKELDLLICILVMNNGFVLMGKSAPASPENLNAELGKKFAYEDAIRRLRPHEGYAPAKGLQRNEFRSS